MKIPEKALLFAIGGGAYVGLELLWRGWSHGSMFVLGGTCFLALGQLGRMKRRLPLSVRMVAGAGICTAGELLFGMLFNGNYGIWDYRGQPFNLGGQICLGFSLLWIPVSGVAMWLYDRCERLLTRPSSAD